MKTAKGLRTAYPHRRISRCNVSQVHADWKVLGAIANITDLGFLCTLMEEREV